MFLWFDCELKFRRITNALQGLEDTVCISCRSIALKSEMIVKIMHGVGVRVPGRVLLIVLDHNLSLGLGLLRRPTLAAERRAITRGASGCPSV